MIYKILIIILIILGNSLFTEPVKRIKRIGKKTLIPISKPTEERVTEKEIPNKTNLPNKKNQKATEVSNLKEVLKDSGRKGIKIASEEELKTWQNSNRVALVVGVNSYKNLSKLSFAVSDSVKMKLTLEQVGDFEKNKIVLLNDEEGEKDPNRLPTKANIERELQKLLKENPYTFFFYFSGHGFMNAQKQNVIAPIDIEYKKDDYIRNEINIDDIVSKAGVSNQSILFIDACREKLTDDTKSGSGEYFDILPPSVQNAAGTAIMMGTAPGGFSYENPELGSGTFTHFLVQGMNGGVQESGVPYVTFASLKEYVEKNIGEYTQKMTSKKQIPYTAGDYTGSFLLSAKPPKGQVESRLSKYQDSSKQIRYSRSIFDVNTNLISQYFFLFGSDRTYIPSDLDGISKLNFELTNTTYKVKQYKLEGEPVFISGFEPLENGNWEYRGIEKENFVKKIFNKQGQEIQSEDYGKNGKLIEESFLSYIRKIEYKSSKIESISYYHLNEKPKEDEISIHKYLYQFDENGNKKLQTNLGTDLKPKEDKNRIASISWNYDRKGNKLLEEYKTLDGKRRSNEKGIAKYTYEYDKNGQVLEEKYYNEENDLLGKKIISHKKFRYDSRGNLISKEFLDSSGDLTEDPTGNARTEYTYDSANRILSETYLGANGKPKQGTIAKKIFEYTSSGKIKSESYFDSKNQPYKDRYYRISRYEYTYDEFGNKTRERYYGVDGKLTKDINGITGKDFIYEDRILVQEKYTDESETYIEDKSGIFQKLFRYNEKGDLISEEFLSRKEHPVQDKNGISIIIYKYNSFGKRIIEETRNLDGKLKENSYKVARKIFQYDKNGNLIGEEHYDADEILKKHDYKLYLSNPFSGKEKTLLIRLDKFRRPIGIETTNSIESLNSTDSAFPTSSREKYFITQLPF